MHECGARAAVGSVRLLAAFAISSHAGAAAAPTATDEAPVSLRWDAPAACPDEVEVQAALVRALAPGTEEPFVDVAVSVAEDGRFVAEVVLRGAWGETVRHLDGRACDALADAVVLLAAVSASGSIDEQGVPPPTVPEPAPVVPSKLRAPSQDGRVTDVEPEPRPPPVALPVTDEPVAQEREPDPFAAPEARLRGLARGEARAGAGVVHRVDLGAAVSMGLSHRWFRAELGAAAWLPQERRIAVDASVRVSLWSAELRGCAALRPADWLVLLPCAGLELGRMRGEGLGRGLAVGRASTQPWMATSVSPAASFRVHRRVGLWVAASAVVPLRRIGFTVEGLASDAHRVAPLAGRGALGVELWFP